MNGKSQLLDVVDALRAIGRIRRTFCTAGISKAISTAMMAITTSNSIRVKAMRSSRAACTMTGSA